MKIRLLLDSRALGGVETHVIALCAELTAQGHDCQIVFIRPYPTNILYKVCEQKKVEYLAPSSYKALFSYLLKDKPDILHAHGYKANVFARLAGLISHTKVVTTFHTGEKPVGRLVLYNFWDRWTSFLSHNLCVNSLIANALPFNSRVIPNFVTMPAAPNPLSVKEPYQIYFIGRVSPEKGPECFGQLSEISASNFEWHLVGTGPLLERCQQKYAKTLHCHGAVLEMDAVWNKVDMLAITSTHEGLPLVLLEAMSRGIPVVSFDVGSIKEVISDIDYVVDCFDLERMQQLISSHFLKPIEERARMAKLARDKIQHHFTTSIVVSQIEAFYKRVLI